MAKIRRTLHKLPAHDPAFDEQFWPVMIALFVLGGFLIGTVLAYLQFDDPRWYANAWVWIFVISVWTCGMIWALRHVHSRAFRRGIQFSAVVCVILHAILLVICVETHIFGKLWEQVRVATERRQREAVVVPQYEDVQHQPERHRQQSFMRPVETETPETEMDELEPEPQEVEPPTETQPTPTPEREVTVHPNVIPRPTPAETVPRQAEQTSQLRRSVAEAQSPANQPVNVPQPSPEPTAQSSALASQNSQLQQRQTESMAERAPAIPDAPAAAAQPTLARSRRTEQTAPDARAAAAPTLPRQINEPREMPLTQVDANVAPAVARQTEPTAPQPANTLARSATTTAPQVERPVAEPNVATPTPVEPNAQRREQQTEQRPTIAQTPVPVPNERTRSTERPDVATVASQVAPSPTPSQSESAVTAASGSVAQATATTQPSRQPTMAEPSVNPTAVAASSTVRRQAEQTPNAAQPNPSPVMRQATNNNLASSTPAPVEQLATQVASAETGAVAPTATATRRQAVTSPQVAMAEGNPTAQVSPNASPSVMPSSVARPNAVGSAPEVTTPSVTSVVTRSASAAQPTAATNASTIESTATTNASRSTAAVAAATGGMARQSTSVNATATDQPSSGGPQLSPSAQIVSGSRAQPADAASIDPQAPATASPSRSARAVELAASPANIESPAMAQGTPGNSAPAPDASRNALTRSLNGVAGVGQSTNLDRALPAADSPALVASGAARRTEATQNMPAGPALAPSAPALVRNSLADADRPTASLQANTLANATQAGSENPTAEAASSSASLTRAESNANPGLMSASAGQVQVDLGPTRIVDEGGASRAAGGGQPELNLASQSQQLTRNTANAAENSSLAAMNVAAEPAAPPGTGGGEPTPQGLAPQLADVGRGEPHATEVASGGAMTGPTGEAANQPSISAVAATSASRAAGEVALPEVASAAGGSTGGEEETEEERARRLAREALGGAPQLATSAELVPGATAANGATTSTTVAESAAANSTMIARAESAGGGALSGEALEPVMNIAAASGGGEVAGPNVVRRAEATDALAGTPVPGGGTASPSRSSASQPFSASVESTVAMIAGAPDSSGVPSGGNVDTLGPEAAPVTGGLQSAPSLAAIGADAGQEIVAGAADNGTLSGLAAQSRSTAADDGPALGSDTESESPLRRSSDSTLSLSTAAAGPEGVPTAPSPSTLADADAANAGLGSDLSPMTRQSTSTASLNVDAIDGPAGLGLEPSAAVGQNTRRSRPDSLQIQAADVRFVRTDIGGLPNFSTAAVIASEAFRRRGTREMGESSSDNRAAPGTDIDKAVELGLAYLVKQQLPDGSWSLQASDNRAALVSDTAATGLALLAFQGYGYTHHDNKYADNVRRGLEFLLANQKPTGDLFISADAESNQSVWLYSHGIAALAMCEAYGMTQDPALKEPAQRCVNFIVESQHPERGGWRYSPNTEADTSVSGWMMMALKSAELANLEVPSETFARIEHWLDLAQGSRSERHLYRYNPYAIDNEEQRHGRRTSTTMTSVGLLMRLYTGWKRDNENMVQGADYLLEHLPAIGTAADPKRDTYYWYYATQVLFHMGGERWEEWNNALRPALVDTQIRSGAMAGSWDPRNPVPDRWAPHAGRLYVTTLNLLSLEVHYRHLPLYEETAK